MGFLYNGRRPHGGDGGGTADSLTHKAGGRVSPPLLSGSGEHLGEVLGDTADLVISLPLDHVGAGGVQHLEAADLLVHGVGRVTRQGEAVGESGNDGLTVTTTGNVGLSDELNLFVGVRGAGLTHSNGSVHNTGGNLLTMVEEAAFLTFQVRQTETVHIVQVLFVELQSDGVSSGQGGEGSGHVSDVFDSFNIQGFGGQVNTPGPVCQVSHQHDARLKGDSLPGLSGSVILTDKPFACLLENSLTVHGMSGADGIQAGLGGLRLITTVKELDEVLTDAGDQVTVQEDFRLPLSVQGHCGIVQSPGSIVGDGSVHEGFDFAHWLPLVDVCIVRGRRGSGCQAVTVYPLSLRGVTTEPKHLKDGTT